MSSIVSLPIDDLGQPVNVIGRPNRIVCLVPNLSETLWHWGFSRVVVGVTDYCVSPPDGFPNAVRVRGTKNPDVAAIIALRPDLVIVNVEENRQLDVQRLRDAGLAVYVTAAVDVPTAAASLGRLGKAVSSEASGTRMEVAIMTALSRHRAIDAGVLPRIAVPIWKDPWMAIGRDTVVGEMLVELGFDLVPDIDRYPNIELDQLHDVDLILLPDEPYAFDDDDRATLLAAVPGRAVRLFDGQALTWWGPRTPGVIADLANLRRHLTRRAARNASRRANGSW
ncbi:MAG: ABC-type Fe3+-hydroxamate transport system substrate-binding protein [Nonlabens sp.]|jgi:ABC-type Fe3+-hydroxamate transport system substrate-binding protein